MFHEGFGPEQPENGFHPPVRSPPIAGRLLTFLHAPEADIIWMHAYPSPAKRKQANHFTR
jgi:hypothetical protein